MWIAVTEILEDDSTSPTLVNLDKVKSIAIDKTKLMAWINFHGEAKVNSKGVLVESFISIMVKDKKELYNLIDKANLLIK